MDINSVLNNATLWLASIAAGLFVLVWTYGGLVRILSAGRSQGITQSKGAIQAAIEGLIIVLVARLALGVLQTLIHRIFGA